MRRSGGEVQRLAQTVERWWEQAHERERRDQMRRRGWVGQRAPRWIPLEPLGRLAHAALEEYLARSECVPQAVEWKDPTRGYLLRLLRLRGRGGDEGSST